MGSVQDYAILVSWWNIRPIQSRLHARNSSNSSLPFDTSSVPGAGSTATKRPSMAYSERVCDLERKPQARRVRVASPRDKADRNVPLRITLSGRRGVHALRVRAAARTKSCIHSSSLSLLPKWCINKPSSDRAYNGGLRTIPQAHKPQESLFIVISQQNRLKGRRFYYPNRHPPWRTENPSRMRLTTLLALAAGTATATATPLAAPSAPNSLDLLNDSLEPLALPPKPQSHNIVDAHPPGTYGHGQPVPPPMDDAPAGADADKHARCWRTTLKDAGKPMMCSDCKSVKECCKVTPYTRRDFPPCNGGGMADNASLHG